MSCEETGVNANQDQSSDGRDPGATRGLPFERVTSVSVDCQHHHLRLPGPVLEQLFRDCELDLALPEAGLNIQYWKLSVVVTC